MNPKERGLLLTVFICVCIILTSIIPYFKQLFVSETGSFSIPGKGFGVLFAIGLFLKWEWMRKVVIALYSFNILLLSFIVPVNLQIGGKLYSFLFLIWLHLVVVLVLYFSRDVKHFLNTNKTDNQYPVKSIS